MFDIYNFMYQNWLYKSIKKIVMIIKTDLGRVLQQNKVDRLNALFFPEPLAQPVWI